MARIWELQSSLYNTFKAESESAINRCHAGYLSNKELTQELEQADKKLTGSLKELRRLIQ